MHYNFIRTFAVRFIVFSCMALALLASSGIAQTVSAHPLDKSISSMPSYSCVMGLTPGTTWDRWSPEHHFDVEYTGLGEMTALVTSGQAQIYFQGQPMHLDYWETNKWGVHTTWVAQHPVSFWSGSNWEVRWNNGTNGVYCSTDSGSNA